MSAGKAIAVAGGVLLLAAVSGCEDWSSEAIAESERIGNEIVVAAEHFRTDSGHVPQSLSELVPRYLPEVRPPTAGSRKWLYVTSDNQGFVLSFGKDHGPCRYIVSGPNEVWHTDDGS